MGHYHYNCDEYCIDCLPVDSNHPDVDYDMGEQDYPANCCVCHEPLDYSLTGDGVDYVINAIKESLDKPKHEWDKVPACYDGTHYEGCRHVEIVRDWANHIKWYGLSEEQEKIVDKFLRLSE